MPSRRDELTPDELPATWTHRAFKDPVAFRDELYVRPARTPCEAAWKVRSYRTRVWAWLEATEAQLVLVAKMPDGSIRFALFLREARLVAGALFVVARDSLSATVFAGRRARAGEPPPPVGRPTHPWPVSASRRRPSAERKARTVRRNKRNRRRTS